MAFYLLRAGVAKWRTKLRRVLPYGDSTEVCEPMPEAYAGRTAPWAHRLVFQYKYPGTPTKTMVVPHKASMGRVMIVFNVHAVPTST